MTPVLCRIAATLTLVLAAAASTVEPEPPERPEPPEVRVETRTHMDIDCDTGTFIGTDTTLRWEPLWDEGTGAWVFPEEPTSAESSTFTEPLAGDTLTANCPTPEPEPVEEPVTPEPAEAFDEERFVRTDDGYVVPRGELG